MSAKRVGMRNMWDFMSESWIGICAFLIIVAIALALILDEYKDSNQHPCVLAQAKCFRHSWAQEERDSCREIFKSCMESSNLNTDRENLICTVVVDEYESVLIVTSLEENKLDRCHAILLNHLTGK